MIAKASMARTLELQVVVVECMFMLLTLASAQHIKPLVVALLQL
jgi:hypothetical protein